jgi:hypothetical protein
VTNRSASAVAAYINGADVTSAIDIAIFAKATIDASKTLASGLSAAIAPIGAAVGINTAVVEMATTVKAYVEAASLTATDDIFIDAIADNMARASVDGGASGTVAAGGMVAKITLGDSSVVDDVLASVGDNAIINAGSLFVTASSQDDLLPQSQAGGGGVLAGLGADSAITSTYDTKARIGQKADINLTGGFSLTSVHTQDVDASADSYAFALALGTGAGVRLSIASSANVEVANDANVEANAIKISAVNELVKDKFGRDNLQVSLKKGDIVGVGAGDLRRRYRYQGNDKTVALARINYVQNPEWQDVTSSTSDLLDVTHEAYVATQQRSNLKSGSGSLANVTILTSETNVGTATDAFEALINIGRGASLKALGSNQKAGTFIVQARTNIDAYDSVDVESFTGLGVSTGRSNVNTNADAKINVTGATLENTAGDLFLTAKSDSNVTTDAKLLVTTVITGGAGASAITNLDVDNTIDLQDATLKGDNVNLFAGQDKSGVPNIINGNTAANISAFSLLPNISEPNPQTTITEKNSINIKGTDSTTFTRILAREDVKLITEEGIGGAKRGNEQGGVVSLSLVPYGSSAIDQPTVQSSNLVTIDNNSRIEAGVNSSSYVLIRPVVDKGGSLGLASDRLGKVITQAEKDALFASEGIELPGNVEYEYAEPNLEQFFYGIIKGTIVKNGSNYYQAQFSDSVLLENENFSNPARWVRLTETAVPANTETNIPRRPAISEVGNNFVESNVVTTFKDLLDGQIYIIKPKDLEHVTLSIENLGQLLLQQRDTLYELIANHSSDPEAVARYEVQLEQVETSLTKLGLESTNGFGTTDTLLVNLPNIYAAPGSIFIQSAGGISATELNQKRQGKQLQVSDQATINIFNYLPFGMVVNDAIVRDNRTLAQVNGESVTLQPGNVFLNNVAVGNENTDVKPATISITQKEIFPTSRFDVDVPDVPNELFIVGDVINENGGVAIRNFDDNINVTGNVRGEPVEIFAAGDFSLNVDGWFHTNRDPRQYLDFQSLQGSGKVKPVETEANPIKLNDPKRANFNNASLVVDNTGTTLQQSIFRDNATAGASIFGATEELKPGRILSLGNIAITANNLNVNGLIQSGVQNIELTIDQSFINSGPNTGFKAFLDDQGNIRNGITFGDDVPIEGYYDAEQQAIIVEDLVPAGGSITLAGRLLSTGNAQLKVAHGYAGIDINNNTDKKLILNTIDNTENRVGKITLIDTARLVNGSITQFKTEYDVTDQGISRQDFTGQLADQVVTDPEGGTTTLKRIQYTTMGQASSVLQAELTKPNPTKVTWAPEAGLFYVWIEGQENTRTIETTYEKNSFNLFGFDTPLARDIADALDKDNSWTERKITYTDDFPLLESEDRVFQTSQVIPPGIAANTIYYVEFERRVDTLVDVIPNSTIVKYVGTDTSKGEKDALYLYKGSVAVELYLPEVNYTTADWEKVTSGVPEYNSDYENSTYTVKPSVSGGGWLQKKQEITKITDIQGQKDYFTQALKADYPIEVLYGIPVDKPTIDIDSRGAVQLDGNVFNPASGVIEITSTEGSVEDFVAGGHLRYLTNH